MPTPPGTISTSVSATSFALHSWLMSNAPSNTVTAGTFVPASGSGRVIKTE